MKPTNKRPAGRKKGGAGQMVDTVLYAALKALADLAEGKALLARHNLTLHVVPRGQAPFQIAIADGEPRLITGAAVAPFDMETMLAIEGPAEELLAALQGRRAVYDIWYENRLRFIPLSYKRHAVAYAVQALDAAQRAFLLQKAGQHT